MPGFAVLALKTLSGNVEPGVPRSWSKFCAGSGVSNPVLSVYCGSGRIGFHSAFLEIWLSERLGDQGE